MAVDTRDRIQCLSAGNYTLATMLPTVAALMPSPLVEFSNLHLKGISPFMKLAQSIQISGWIIFTENNYLQKNTHI
jgi:hypothetical protein